MENDTDIAQFYRILQRYKKVLFLLTSIFFLVCFYFFSVLVKKRYFNQFDFNATVKVQDDIPTKIDKIFTVFSSIASIEGVAILLIILLIFRRQIFRGLLLLFIFFSAHAVELFGKLYIHHPPPAFMFYKHLDATQFNFDKYFVQQGNSYPSGHSFRTVFFTILFIYTVCSLKRLSPYVKLLLSFGGLLFIILVGVSRVALGEHWTSDVIGGGLFGIATSLFSLVFL